MIVMYKDHGIVNEIIPSLNRTKEIVDRASSSFNGAVAPGFEGQSSKIIQNLTVISDNCFTLVNWLEDSVNKINSKENELEIISSSLPKVKILPKKSMITSN